MSAAAEPDWTDLAGCGPWPAHWWTRPSHEHRRRAITICRGCGVRAECLGYGLNEDRMMRWPRRQHPVAPIYGGLTAGERSLWARSTISGATPLGAGDAAAG